MDGEGVKGGVGRVEYISTERVGYVALRAFQALKTKGTGPARAVRKLRVGLKNPAVQVFRRKSVTLESKRGELELRPDFLFLMTRRRSNPRPTLFGQICQTRGAVGRCLQVGCLRLCWVLALMVMSSLIGQPLYGVDLNTISGLKVQDGVVTVEFADNPGVYYLLEHSDNLQNWAPADMSLGIASELDLAPGTTNGFFRAVPYSQFSPIDTDGDGIDDMFELNHPGILDPLNPHDGSLDPDGNGKTTYQEYLELFGIISFSLLQRESREWSIFNFGSAPAFDSVSREQSIFNFGSPIATVQADSREVSLYNGQAVPVSDLHQRESREWSVFNFGSPLASAEAISRSVSLYNGQAVPISDLLQVESREVSVFNFGSPLATLEAISREVSVLNFEEP